MQREIPVPIRRTVHESIPRKGTLNRSQTNRFLSYSYVTTSSMNLSNSLHLNSLYEKWYWKKYLYHGVVLITKWYLLCQHKRRTYDSSIIGKKESNGLKHRGFGPVIESSTRLQQTLTVIMHLVPTIWKAYLKIVNDNGSIF